MNKTNKILLLCPSLPGGVAAFYNTLKLEKFWNIDYFIINSPNKQSGFETFRRLVGNYFIFFYKIIHNQYDLIHLNPSLGKRSFYRDSIFIIIARILHKNTLVLFNGWQEPFEREIKKSRFKRNLFKISYAKANTFIVLSQLFKKKLQELGVPLSTPFFSITTVADSRFIKELNLEKKVASFEEKVIFLVLSRITKEKGIYIALDAFKAFSMLNTKQKSCLKIAGDGEELAAAKDYVVKQNISNVVFLNHVSDDKKNKVLQESHIMLLTSYSEGLPNSILEGMLYGMPIISRITGGIPDIIKQRENGFLTESLDPFIFADFMNIILNDKNLYKKIAFNNHRIALENYTTEKIREQFDKIYSECLTNENHCSEKENNIDRR